MKTKSKTRYLLLLIVFLSNSHVFGCRLFSMISENSVPLNQIGQTQIYLDELQALGVANPDGWSILFYQDAKFNGNGSIGGLYRNSYPANETVDGINYDDAQLEVLNASNVTTLMCHLRNATSGCGNGLDESTPNNPHPWIWETQDGNSYSFAHNGTIYNKLALRELIGESFIAENGGLQTFESYGCGGDWNENEGLVHVVDSELYFFWIMKNILEKNGNILQGMHTAISDTNFRNITSSSHLNFTFSDGVSLWAYKKGMDPLYWKSNPCDANLFKTVMTEPSDNSWTAMENDQLIYLPRGGEDVIYNALSDADALFMDPPEVPTSFKLYGNYPNPFNARTQISFYIPTLSDVTLTIFNIMGQELESVTLADMSSGQHTFDWQSKANPSGLYLYQIKNLDVTQYGKALLVK